MDGLLAIISVILIRVLGDFIVPNDASLKYGFIVWGISMVVGASILFIV